MAGAPKPPDQGWVDTDTSAVVFFMVVISCINSLSALGLAMKHNRTCSCRRIHCDSTAVSTLPWEIQDGRNGMAVVKKRTPAFLGDG
jgi:hypothetical protein